MASLDHSQRLPQQLSFRLNQFSCLLWGSKHLGGRGPRLIQEPAEHPCWAASGASPLRSHPWPVAACQACWPTAAEPQPPASSAVWLEHPASAATSSCAGQRRPVKMEVGEEHNQPFRSSAGSALGVSPSSCAREGPSKSRFCSHVLVPSWKFNIQKHKLG